MKGVSESFKQRADSAAFYEAWVGAVLSRAGLYTLHHPFIADGGDYHSHTWDLDISEFGLTLNSILTPAESNQFTQVEVKSLNLTFYNIDSYPFDDVLVCSQNSWLKKWPGKSLVQRDFLFVSRPTGTILWLPKGSPVTLGHEVTDGSRGETYKAVKTKKEHLRPLADFVEAVRG